MPNSNIVLSVTLIMETYGLPAIMHARMYCTCVTHNNIDTAIKVIDIYRMSIPVV